MDQELIVSAIYMMLSPAIDIELYLKAVQRRLTCRYIVSVIGQQCHPQIQLDISSQMAVVILPIQNLSYLQYTSQPSEMQLQSLQMDWVSLIHAYTHAV